MARYKSGDGKGNDGGGGWWFRTRFIGSEFESGGRESELLQLIYSVGGLLLGLACIVGWVVLFLAGVTGKTNWSAKFFGAITELTDAAPGVILFVVGLFIVWVTKFKLFKRELPQLPEDKKLKDLAPD